MCRQDLDGEYLLKGLFEDVTIFSNRALDATAEGRPDGKFDIKLDIETHKYKAAAKKGGELSFESLAPRETSETPTWQMATC